MQEFINETRVLLDKLKKAVPAIFRKYWELPSTIMPKKKHKEISKLSPMKISKKGDFPHISGIFGRKIFFLKNRTRHCKYASLCRKSEKTCDEISRKCQKTGFSGIFPAISVGKLCFFFENRALSHFRYCNFASVCKVS